MKACCGLLDTGVVGLTWENRVTPPRHKDTKKKAESKSRHADLSLSFSLLGVFVSWWCIF